MSTGYIRYRMLQTLSLSLFLLGSIANSVVVCAMNGTVVTCIYIYVYIWGEKRVLRASYQCHTSFACGTAYD